METTEQKIIAKQEALIDFLLKSIKDRYVYQPDTEIADWFQSGISDLKQQLSEEKKQEDPEKSSSEELRNELIKYSKWKTRKGLLSSTILSHEEIVNEYLQSLSKVQNG